MNELSIVPTCISNFHSLTSLNLSNNNIINPFPSSLNLLKRLVDLDISFVPLDEQIEYLKNSIYKIYSLAYLSLNNCFQSNTNLEGIENLSNLKKLNISNNNINHFPNCILNLLHLEILILSNNEIINLPDLTNLKYLKHLDVQNNKISFFRPDIINTGSLKLTEEFLFGENPLDSSYRFNGIFPPSKVLLQQLESQYVELNHDNLHYSNNMDDDNLYESSLNSLDQHVFVPIISLFFVGPTKSGKTNLIQTWFPELKQFTNQKQETQKYLIDISNNNVADSKKPVTNHGIQFFPVINNEINDTPFHFRIREFEGFEENECIFYDWFLFNTKPIFIVVWRISQALDSSCIQYWMELARNHKDDHCVIIIAIYNDDQYPNAKNKFYSYYPPDKYQIIDFILLHTSEISDESFSLFTEALSQSVQNYQLIEPPFEFGKQTEDILVHFNNYFTENNKPPFTSISEYKKIAKEKGISNDIHINQSIIYLQQTGSGIKIEENIILNLQWISNLLNISIPRNLPSSDDKIIGFIDSSTIMTQLLFAFNDNSINIRCIINLLYSCKIFSFYESKFFFPSIMPFICCKEKGAFWKGKFDSCTLSHCFSFRFLSVHMIHFLHVSLFSTIIELVDYNSFINFSLGEWTLKEPNGNYIFFQIKKESKQIILSAISFSAMYENLIKIAEAAISNWDLFWDKN